jgi:methionine-S-sulfoxide reductase
MTTERAVLAGGCFWGMQDLIRKLPGVISTRVGCTGGDVPNATYRNHGTHAEAIEIIFDPSQTTYRRLLEFFFQIHDPTTLNRQGNDLGTSYRSAIYFISDEQKAVALDTTYSAPIYLPFSTSELGVAAQDRCCRLDVMTVSSTPSALAGPREAVLPGFPCRDHFCWGGWRCTSLCDPAAVDGFSRPRSVGAHDR